MKAHEYLSDFSGEVCEVVGSGSQPVTARGESGPAKAFGSQKE